MVEIGKQVHFIHRDDWRAWLQEHHAAEQAIWLIFYKKHTGLPGLSYEDVLEEALCFGWIDGIMKRLDDARYVLRFSLRKSDSIWSESNKRRVARLIEQGRMTEFGLVRVRQAQENGEWDKATQREDVTDVPTDLEQALQASEGAWHNFQGLAPSYRRQFIYWVASARTPETRRRRIRETVRLAAEKKRLDIGYRMEERTLV